MSTESRAAFTREATVNEKTWPSASVATVGVANLLPFLDSDVQVNNDQRAIVERRTRRTAQAENGTATRRRTFYRYGHVRVA